MKIFFIIVPATAAFATWLLMTAIFEQGKVNTAIELGKACEYLEEHAKSSSFFYSGSALNKALAVCLGDK